MSDRDKPYRAFSSDGHAVHWSAWDETDTNQVSSDAGQASPDAGNMHELLSLTWENEAWTATGNVGREQVQYVMRISPTWHVRQLLLFRDMDDPDLWLGTDGHGRWGEMNGAHRPELDGCIDIELTCTPFTHSLPIRRLPLRVGDSTEITVASIDVETLDVQPDFRRYTRLGAQRWRLERLADSATPTPTPTPTIEFDVDEFGLVTDIDGHFRRRP